MVAPVVLTAVCRRCAALRRAWERPLGAGEWPSALTRRLARRDTYCIIASNCTCAHYVVRVSHNMRLPISIDLA